MEIGPLLAKEEEEKSSLEAGGEEEESRSEGGDFGNMTGKGIVCAGDQVERKSGQVYWRMSNFFCHGVDERINGVGVVVKEECVKSVLDVKRVCDTVMSVKLEFEGVMLKECLCICPAGWV